MRDPFGDYLRTISRYEVLSRREELLLGNRVQNYIKVQCAIQLSECVPQLKRQWRVSDAEIEKIKSLGSHSKRKMVNHNLKLVVSVARGYLNRGLSIEDLVQEGTIGLNRAVEKFNPYMGFKFSTYGTHWVKQSITRSIARNVRLIRLPSHIYEQLNKLKKATRILSQTNGKTPSIREISNYTGFSIDTIIALRKHSKSVKSLSTPVRDGESTIELLEFIPDESTPLEDKVASSLLSDFVLRTIDDVLKTERERNIMRFRYGLDGYEPISIKDIAAIYGVTSERIRQIDRVCISAIKADIKSMAMYLGTKSDFDLQDLREIL